MLQKACREHADMPSSTLAKMLYKRHPELWPDVEAARDGVRGMRGVHGKARRVRQKSNEALYREPLQSGFVWKFPESQAEEWHPFNLQAKRTLVLSDIHVPFHDMKAVRAAVEWGKKWGPDAVLLNGDICDCFSISRFDKNPTTTTLLNEINTTRQFLGWLQESFRKARIIFKEGNHDERMDRYLWVKAPELLGVPQLTLQHLICDARENEPGIEGIEWIGDQRQVKAGFLSVLHGHEMVRATIAPPVNPARGAFLRSLECVMVGHGHRSSQHSEASLNGRLIACWSTGCLCGLHPEYSRVNKWDHSFATIELSGNDFSVELLRMLHGKVL